MNLKTLALILKGLRVSGSWSQCMRKKTERGLSMNRKVGQASRLSGSAGFQPAPAGKMPALLHRQDACATCNPGSWSQCMRTDERALSMNRAVVGQASRLPLGRLAPGFVAGEMPARIAGTAARLPTAPPLGGSERKPPRRRDRFQLSMGRHGKSARGLSPVPAQRTRPFRTYRENLRGTAGPVRGLGKITGPHRLEVGRVDPSDGIPPARAGTQAGPSTRRRQEEVERGKHLP